MRPAIRTRKTRPVRRGSLPEASGLGVANVTQRYPRPQGTHEWDQWKFESSKLIGGLWYSTQQGGNCDDPEAKACKWRIAETVKTVNASCANANVHAAVSARNSSCFGACSPADQHDATSDCFIRCFFGTLLSPAAAMVPDDVVKPFEAAFTSEDPALQGCPAL